jgi:hypothetical protein
MPAVRLGLTALLNPPRFFGLGFGIALSFRAARRKRKFAIGQEPSSVSPSPLHAADRQKDELPDWIDLDRLLTETEVNRR